MSGFCRIYRKHGRGIRLIAEVRGGRVTGREAATVRKLLKQCGWPHAPIDAVIDALLLADHTLGAALIPERKDFGP